ncbi:diacylglycerol kinase family protein [Thermotoga sp. KOL6]|uniref:diacylglycerol/lipid kinase family protein n=1 Tax=Thermotoga sp. KOL6 TaxID=126741 RepID=UPI000C776352|nr:diacylglycerol kinase family protein [Thermotoga sp. KOL6]PLV59095.1 diacylglycerol kinase [Thermotoga sp. KOL6]
MSVVFLICNPVSNSGNTGKVWPKVKKILEKYGISYEVIFTKKPGHAVEISRDACMKGYDRIVAMGGDGTVNEVVNGVFLSDCDLEKVTFGWIPVGSGKDWARTINVPLDLEKAVEVLKKGKTFVQDLGIAEYEALDGKRKKRAFVNVAGLFFDGFVTYRTNLLKKKSRFSYFLRIFSSILKYKPTDAIIVIDGKKWKKKVFSMNVGICKYNGGGMNQVPHAVPDDGLLAVTVINDIGKLRILANVHRVFNGKLLEHPGVEGYQAQRVTVEFQKEEPIELDGETIWVKKVTFSILPKALKVMVEK